MTKFAIGSVLLAAVLSAQPVPPPDPSVNSALLGGGVYEGAKPLTLSEKVDWHGTRIVSPGSLIATALTAGIRQWQNSPGRWGHGWDGYARRYGTNLARTGIRESIALGINSAAHIDPRYFYVKPGSSTKARLFNAVKQVVIAKTDSGNTTFRYGNVIGALAAGQAGRFWQPYQSDGRFTDGIQSSGIYFATDAARNVFREFWPDIRRKVRRKP